MRCPAVEGGTDVDVSEVEMADVDVSEVEMADVDVSDVEGPDGGG